MMAQEQASIHNDSRHEGLLRFVNSVRVATSSEDARRHFQEQVTEGFDFLDDYLAMIIAGGGHNADAFNVVKTPSRRKDPSLRERAAAASASKPRSQASVTQQRTYEKENLAPALQTVDESKHEHQDSAQPLPSPPLPQTVRLVDERAASSTASQTPPVVTKASSSRPPIVVVRRPAPIIQSEVHNSDVPVETGLAIRAVVPSKPTTDLSMIAETTAEEDSSTGDRNAPTASPKSSLAALPVSANLANPVSENTNDGTTSDPPTEAKLGLPKPANNTTTKTRFNLADIPPFKPRVTAPPSVPQTQVLQQTLQPAVAKEQPAPEPSRAQTPAPTPSQPTVPVMNRPESVPPPATASVAAPPVKTPRLPQGATPTAQAQTGGKRTSWLQRGRDYAAANGGKRTSAALGPTAGSRTSVANLFNSVAPAAAANVAPVTTGSKRKSEDMASLEVEAEDRHTKAPRLGEVPVAESTAPHQPTDQSHVADDLSSHDSDSDFDPDGATEDYVHTFKQAMAGLRIGRSMGGPNAQSNSNNAQLAKEAEAKARQEQEEAAAVEKHREEARLAAERKAVEEREREEQARLEQEQARQREAALAADRERKRREAELAAQRALEAERERQRKEVEEREKERQRLEAERLERQRQAEAEAKRQEEEARRERERHQEAERLERLRREEAKRLERERREEVERLERERREEAERLECQRQAEAEAARKLEEERLRHEAEEKRLEQQRREEEERLRLEELERQRLEAEKQEREAEKREEATRARVQEAERLKTEAAAQQSGSRFSVSELSSRSQSRSEIKSTNPNDTTPPDSPLRKDPRAGSLNGDGPVFKPKVNSIFSSTKPVFKPRDAPQGTGAFRDIFARTGNPVFSRPPQPSASHTGPSAPARNAPVSAHSTFSSIASDKIFDHDSSAPAWAPNTQETDIDRTQSQSQPASKMHDDDFEGDGQASWLIGDEVDATQAWKMLGGSALTYDDTADTWSTGSRKIELIRKDDPKPGEMAVESPRASLGHGVEPTVPDAFEDGNLGTDANDGSRDASEEAMDTGADDDQLAGSSSSYQPTADSVESSQESRPLASSSNFIVDSASKLFSSVFGSKKPVKSLQLAAAAAKKDEEDKEKKATRLRNQETRRILAQQRKADEEKARAETEQKRLKEEQERRKRERDDTTDKRPIKLPTKKLGEDDTKKRKLGPDVEKKTLHKKQASRDLQTTASRNVAKPKPGHMKQPSVPKLVSAAASTSTQPSVAGSSSTKPATVSNATDKSVDYARPKTPSRFAAPQPPREKSENIELPDIASEYSDSDDEERNMKKAALPSWVQSPDVRNALERQGSMNPDAIFGSVQELHMEEIFPGRVSRFRARTSSANWTGADCLTAEEERAYATRMRYD